MSINSRNGWFFGIKITFDDGSEQRYGETYTWDWLQCEIPFEGVSKINIYAQNNGTTRRLQFSDSKGNVIT